ncbi:MAG: hypothetical protein CMN79_05480 [Spirochaetales bacterium]|jgi:hypothetical protein|nr:hypothetical protein [Spirochaetales bacterium]|tara:strand:+ start:2854 stop:3384 length:531 start_codon:yes stop_codon:yes gene_type:complete
MNKKKINNKLKRHPKIVKNIYFLRDKKIISRNYSRFKKKYNIHSLIAFHPFDFKQIKKNMKKLTHFNIQYTDHRSGKNYILVKIKKAGYFNNNIFKPSIYCMRKFFLTKCISVTNNINCKNLRPKNFKNSITNIKNVYTLKKAIIRRYKKSLAHLSDLEKLSMGVAITELKIIKIL